MLMNCKQMDRMKYIANTHIAFIKKCYSTDFNDTKIETM